MGHLQEYEALGHQRWEKMKEDPEYKTPVVYFGYTTPEDFLDVGWYLGYRDFRDAQHDAGIANEPLAGIYHSYVLHLVNMHDPEFYNAVYRDLRYNPQNRASWNTKGPSYQYFLDLSVLAPYAREPVLPEYKIDGVGKKGRQILRLCIDENPFDVLPPKADIAAQTQVTYGEEAPSDVDFDEVVAGLYATEVSVKDMVLNPRFWAKWDVGQYVTKPLLRAVAESLGYSPTEAGTLFGELIRALTGRDGVGGVDGWDLGRYGTKFNGWPRGEYETMYILGTDAVQEILDQNLLGWRMSERRRDIVKTLLNLVVK